jgi:hypothetical protein
LGLSAQLSCALIQTVTPLLSQRFGNLHRHELAIQIVKAIAVGCPRRVVNQCASCAFGRTTSSGREIPPAKQQHQMRFIVRMPWQFTCRNGGKQAGDFRTTGESANHTTSHTTGIPWRKFGLTLVWLLMECSRSQITFLRNHQTARLSCGKHSNIVELDRRYKAKAHLPLLQKQCQPCYGLALRIASSM